MTASLPLPRRPAGNWIARLRRFAAPRLTGEFCEFCGARLGEAHAHLVEPAAHRLHCACDACAAARTAEAAARYRLVPRTARRLAGFVVDEAAWTALRLPIDLAFFYYSSPERRIVAFYPSPAGATQSTLSLAAWSELTGREPALARLQPDVEALLVNRLGTARDAYLLPIDTCYALTGEIRRRWKGLSAGYDANDFVAAYLHQLIAAPAEAGDGARPDLRRHHGRA